MRIQAVLVGFVLVLGGAVGGAARIVSLKVYELRSAWPAAK